MPGPVTGNTQTVPSVSIRSGESRPEVARENEGAARRRASTLGTKDTFTRAEERRSAGAIGRTSGVPSRDGLRTYTELSANQQRLLGPEGEQIWEGLPPRNKAAFIVLTTRMDQNGVDYSGMRLKGGEAGIQVDRLLLERDPADPGGQQRFRQSIFAGGIRWSESKPKSKYHPGMDEYGFRENRTRESMQIGVGSDGAFVDIDRWNPKGLFPFGLTHHVLEATLFRGKTDMFRVARALHIDLWTRTSPPAPGPEAPPPNAQGL